MTEERGSEIKTDIQLLLECLKCQFDNPTALKQALITISSIAATNGPVKDYIRESGGLSFIFSLVSKSSNSEVMQSAMYCVGCCIEGNVFSQKFLTDANIFSIIHNIYVSKTTTESLKNTATFFLLCLVANNSHGQSLARQTSCIDDLLDIFKNTFSGAVSVNDQCNKSKIDLWCNVTSALCMCVNNPQNADNQQACIVVLPMSLRLLQDCTHEKIFCSLTSLLGMLLSNNSFNQDRVRTCGGLEILILRLKKLISSAEEKDIHLAINLIGTIDLCMSENRKNCERLTKLDSLSYLIQLLRYSCLDEQEKLQIVLTIGHFIDLVDLNLKMTHESDGLTILIHLLTEAVDNELIIALKYVLQLCTVPINDGKKNTDTLSKEYRMNTLPDHTEQRSENSAILEKIEELEQKLQDLERTEMNNTSSSIMNQKKHTTVDLELQCKDNRNSSSDFPYETSFSDKICQEELFPLHHVKAMTSQNTNTTSVKYEYTNSLSKNNSSSVSYLDILRCQNDILKKTDQISTEFSKDSFAKCTENSADGLKDQNMSINGEETSAVSGEKGSSELQGVGKPKQNTSIRSKQFESPLRNPVSSGSDEKVQSPGSILQKATTQQQTSNPSTMQNSETISQINTKENENEIFLVKKNQEKNCLDNSEIYQSACSSPDDSIPEVNQINTTCLKSTASVVVSNKEHVNIPKAEEIQTKKEKKIENEENTKTNEMTSHEFTVPKVPVKKTCSYKIKPTLSVRSPCRMNLQNSVTPISKSSSCDPDSRCLKVIPLNTSICDTSLNESCVSLFDCELLKQAKLASRCVQPRTSTPVASQMPDFRAKNIRYSRNKNLCLNFPPQSPVLSNDTSGDSDSDSPLDDTGSTSSNPDIQVNKNKKCPGCQPPVSLNGPLLNSRTFNISIETSSGTCQHHREIRRVERKWMQGMKNKLQHNPRKCRLKKKVLNREEAPDTYDFFTSSSSSETNLSPARESEFESTPAANKKQVSKKCNNNISQKERRNRVPYSEEEIETLQEAVSKMGTRWNQILCTYKFHPCRTAIDLKEKFTRLQKDMNVSMRSKARTSRRRFSMCEERRLRKGVRRYGFNWKLILSSYKFQPSRTGDDLRSKWRNMSKKSVPPEE